MTTKLVGRDAELQVLTGLIDQAGAGGSAIVVTGEPGIGKSALLAEAEAQARAAGCRVLAATGVESEAQLPFAGLHQLPRPLRAAREQLKPAHRRALLAAFASVPDLPQARHHVPGSAGRTARPGDLAAGSVR